MTLPKAAHAQSADAALSALGVGPEKGLSEEEAARRRIVWRRILLDQLKSPLVLLLAGAAVASAIFGEPLETAAIVVVIVLDAAIGFTAEYRGLSSMAALREMAKGRAAVRRGGAREEIEEIEEINADALVPGDVVLIEAGDVIAADLRLIEASKLQIDESALTGESVPVDKQTREVDEDADLADRRSMAYRGTAVTRGAGAGVVAATGQATQLGRISEMVAGAEAEASPLERRLEHLSKQLLWVVLGVAAAVTVTGAAKGRELIDMVSIAIALAVAAVPQGLPVVSTLALARGMWRMAARNALVERLNVVETLGSTTVVFTDKTGTLTENRMTVTDLALAGGRYRRGEDTEPLAPADDTPADDTPADDTPRRRYRGGRRSRLRAGAGGPRLVLQRRARR